MYSLCMYKASSTLTTIVAEICDYRQFDAVSADYIVAVFGIGDYTRQCGRGFKVTKITGTFSSC